MAILPGRRLGPYEILTAIGAGGMGEVYTARDTRLYRIVAIKVLPAHLADRAELRERFEREARTIASLNHPHICTLCDTGHQDGIDYLVMEYLEGQTLAQRLQKGALPLEQVLQYAIEIADALDKAHRKGVTHRDLKPGNIMLTKTGTKLLDFGLAKRFRSIRWSCNILKVALGISWPSTITIRGRILQPMRLRICQKPARERTAGPKFDSSAPTTSTRWPTAYRRSRSKAWHLVASAPKEEPALRWHFFESRFEERRMRQPSRVSFRAPLRYNSGRSTGNAGFGPHSEKCA